MENHPIPQDITGFQFKLIGEMTLKQFAYLAVGTVLAWIVFSTPVNFFIKLPFSSIFVLFGVSFAFLSISGRPIDTMLLNFMRATFSPTKYIYQNQNIPQPVQKTDMNSSTPPTPVSEAASASLETSAPKNELNKREFDFFRMLTHMLHQSPTSQPAQTVGDHDESKPYIVSAKVQGEEKHQDAVKNTVSEKDEASKDVDLQKETENLQEELKKAVANEKASEGLPTYEDAHKKALEIEKTLNETLVQKQQLEKEIAELKKQIENQKKEVYAPSRTAPAQTPNVRTISNKAQGKSAGLPTIPEYPNIITGIIKDPRGNPLSNILVEVKDPEGNPVRAFKTSPLGQFQASTPLTNGGYTIEFEDPSGMNKFDKIGFQATGDVIFPIEVLSIDRREELRKSLFN